MSLPPAAAGSAVATKIGLEAPDTPAPFAAPAPEKPVTSASEKPNSVIPEPAAAALGLLGLGLILFRRFRA
jgi:MYXO-CTERM domain-containing protein